MTRLVTLMVAVVAFGCATKPSEEDCRKAITNMQTLMGTEPLSDPAMVESQVRRCKGGSTKKSVTCAINAKTLDDLRKCDFYKVPENARGIGPSPAGSAADSAGSAATGSAAAGSAAAGSADAASSAGSAATGSGDAAGSAGSAAGSAGSAATGSAAAGSAAAGSAAPGAAP